MELESWSQCGEQLLAGLMLVCGKKSSAPWWDKQKWNFLAQARNKNEFNLQQTDEQLQKIRISCYKDCSIPTSRFPPVDVEAFSGQS